MLYITLRKYYISIVDTSVIDVKKIKCFFFLKIVSTLCGQNVGFVMLQLVSHIINTDFEVLRPRAQF
jgi:hypothetical protein